MVKADELLKALTNPDAANTSIHTFLSAILDKLGGVSRLAEMIADDLDALEPGHTGRISLEKTLIAAMAAHGQDLGEAEADPEQLKALALELLATTE